MKPEDVDFILSHFQDQTQLFPRKIMTHTSNGQFSVYSKEEVFERCKQSQFTDCRINAYPEYTEYKGIVREAPNFVFIDLDIGNFDHDTKKLNLALRNTVKKIKEHQSSPTILWTGNGYHLYLPISAIVLDQESIFSKEKFSNLFSAMGKYSNWSVSEVFLKYTEIFFTNGKADPLHKPKYKTSLIRIPGTHNSKLLNKGLKEESLVKVIQKWDRNRISIQYLLKDFRRWLIQEDLDQQIAKNKRRRSGSTPWLSKTIPWIENLLQTPLEDNRKYCIFHVLIPYLVNVKGLSTEEVSFVIIQWLSKCNLVKSLDFIPSVEINNRIKFVKNFRPMSIEKLKSENKDLYHALTT
jgi:hypothetical protein